jgi:protein phosphatase
VALIAGGRLRLSHVGDTRAYLARDGQVFILTRDHSVRAARAAIGDLRPDETDADAAGRNVLLRHLGKKGLKESEVDGLCAGQVPLAGADGTLALHHGDRLLLCTDGVWGWWDDRLDAERQQAYLIRHLATGDDDPHARARRLLDDALLHDGSDNASLLVVEYRRCAMHGWSVLVGKTPAEAEADGDGRALAMLAAHGWSPDPAASSGEDA